MNSYKFSYKHSGSLVSFYFIDRDSIHNMPCKEKLGVTVDYTLKLHSHVYEINSNASDVAQSIYLTL